MTIAHCPMCGRTWSLSQDTYYENLAKIRAQLQEEVHKDLEHEFQQKRTQVKQLLQAVIDNLDNLVVIQ